MAGPVSNEGLLAEQDRRADDHGVDVERIRRTAERLRGEFSTIVRALPPELRTIAGLASALNVPRPTCQRLLRGLRTREPLEQSLTYYPGVRGLQQILDGARRRGLDEATLAGAMAALRQLADLMTDYGGSQSRLNDAIAEALSDSAGWADDHADSQGRATADRQRAFESNRRLTRRLFDTQLAVYIYRPVRGRAGLMHSVTAMGMIGMERDANALPLCIVSSSVPKDEAHAHAVDADAGISGLPISVLREFSSSPPPAVTVRQQPGRVTVLMEPPEGERSDLVLARRFSEIPHPARDEPRQQFCWLLSEGPSRNLLMQVYVHRSMARASIPSADAYFVGSRGIVGSMSFDENGGQRFELPAFRWFDRLPDGPRLEQLGHGIRGGHHCYPRLGALANQLIQAQGWDAEEFVAMQCHAHYPVWGAQYLITLDFSSEDDVED